MSYITCIYVSIVSTHHPFYDLAETNLYFVYHLSFPRAGDPGVPIVSNCPNSPEAPQRRPWRSNLDRQEALCNWIPGHNGVWVDVANASSISLQLKVSNLRPWNSQLFRYWLPWWINLKQGLVNVPIKHHPTIGDISSPTDICFGDVQHPQKIPSIPTPVEKPRKNCKKTNGCPLRFPRHTGESGGPCFSGFQRSRCWSWLSTSATGDVTMENHHFWWVNQHKSTVNGNFQ